MIIVKQRCGEHGRAGVSSRFGLTSFERAPRTGVVNYMTVKLPGF